MSRHGVSDGIVYEPPIGVEHLGGAVKLYYVPLTRSNRPRWMLEEMELPYELVRLDPKLGDNKKPDYLAINPTGKVPSLADGDVKMFESAAIVAYLADKYPDRKLAPPVGANERAAYYQWLFFGMTTLEQPVSLYAQHTSSLPPEKRVPQVAEDAKAAAERALAALERSLGNREWLLGRFTAADIVVGATVVWASVLKLLDPYPALVSYVKRLKERPAFQRSRQD
jgi:glutathione S-transferase